MGNNTPIAPQIRTRAGFRVVGRRMRIGRLHGVWRDVILLERRSRVVG
jgi:L-amino acid N-acyltransferase YncA